MSASEHSKCGTLSRTQLWLSLRMLANGFNLMSGGAPSGGDFAGGGGGDGGSGGCGGGGCNGAALRRRKSESIRRKSEDKAQCARARVRPSRREFDVMMHHVCAVKTRGAAGRPSRLLRSRSGVAYWEERIRQTESGAGARAEAAADGALGLEQLLTAPTSFFILLTWPTATHST